MYILYEFTVFIDYLVREPERNVQGVVMYKEWCGRFSRGGGGRCGVQDRCEHRRW